MQVDDALIEKLAELSMLQFDETEKEEIKADLQKMIGFIDKLKELDTTGVEPLMHLSEEVNNVWITKRGNIDLFEGIPATIEEIEAVMKVNR